MNNWYNRINNITPVQPSSPVQQQTPGMQFQNPLQKYQYIMQAMANPAAFVKQHIPDIPDDMLNDPGRILEYLKRTRGVTDQQIQQLMSRGGPRW